MTTYRTFHLTVPCGDGRPKDYDRASLNAVSDVPSVELMTPTSRKPRPGDKYYGFLMHEGCWNHLKDRLGAGFQERIPDLVRILSDRGTREDYCYGGARDFQGRRWKYWLGGGTYELQY